MFVVNLIRIEMVDSTCVEILYYLSLLAYYHQQTCNLPFFFSHLTIPTLNQGRNFLFQTTVLLMFSNSSLILNLVIQLEHRFCFPVLFLTCGAIFTRRMYTFFGGCVSISPPFRLPFHLSNPQTFTKFMKMFEWLSCTGSFKSY